MPSVLDPFLTRSVVVSLGEIELELQRHQEGLPQVGGGTRSHGSQLTRLCPFHALCSAAGAPPWPPSNLARPNPSATLNLPCTSLPCSPRTPLQAQPLARFTLAELWVAFRNSAQVRRHACMRHSLPRMGSRVTHPPARIAVAVHCRITAPPLDGHLLVHWGSLRPAPLHSPVPS